MTTKPASEEKKPCRFCEVMPLGNASTSPQAESVGDAPETDYSEFYRPEKLEYTMCGKIYARHKDGTRHMFMDVRGWGHLTGGGSKALSHDVAAGIQDAWAKEVCELWNNTPQSTKDGERQAALDDLYITDSVRELLRLEDNARGKHTSGEECKALFSAWRKLDFPETLKFFRAALTAKPDAGVDVDLEAQAGLEPLDENAMRDACLFFPCGVDMQSVEDWFTKHGKIANEMMARYRAFGASGRLSSKAEWQGVKSNPAQIKVHVVSYDSEKHQLNCVFPDGTVREVDPFVGCAIECTDDDYVEKGEACVGKDFIMTDSWQHGVFLCQGFKEIPQPPITKAEE